ncbi:hypothetical protein O9929_14565 [Vibrio lentus]|nr:hypothetical protein [Vibrio lentus]
MRSVFRFVPIGGHSGAIRGRQLSNVLKLTRYVLRTDRRQAVKPVERKLALGDREGVVEAPVNIGSRAFPLVELVKRYQEECE